MIANFYLTLRVRLFSKKTTTQSLTTVDVLLLIISFLFILLGIAGSLLPVLPGLPISWVGLFLFYCQKTIDFNWWILGISAVLVVIISALDYLLPGMATKKYGGSKYGIWGANIGLVIGLIAPIPFGFIIGPFLGAFIGEMAFNNSDQATSFKAAVGSFWGFLASTFMKFVLAIGFLGLWIYLAFQFRNLIF